MAIRAALDQVRRVTQYQALAVGYGRKAWRQIGPDGISEVWAEQIPALAGQIRTLQTALALDSSIYGAYALAEQGPWVAPEGFVNPAGFAGWFAGYPDARVAVPIESLLYSPAIKAKQFIGGGWPAGRALDRACQNLDRLLASGVADTARQAAGADISTRRDVGYIRQLVGASCSRCVVLAGKWYRWNEGFDRHPQDDCEHHPALEAASNGLVTDPYEYFHSLTEAEQDRRWGQANAQAIRDGADIYQVTNAGRGRRGMFTSEGTSRRGNAAAGLKRGQRRLTPEGIYQLYPDREHALEALRQHGYLLPGGQVPGGSLRGWDYEGYGQMGRGGTRKAATEAVLDARRTGIRDPNNRYTMTAAERYDYDIQMRYQAVLEGRSPFVSPGFGNTPDPTGRLRGYGASSASGRVRLPTPREAAMVEEEYRRWLTTGGPARTRSTATLTSPSHTSGTPTSAALKAGSGSGKGPGSTPPAPPAAGSPLDETPLPILPAHRRGKVTITAGEHPEPHELQTMQRLADLGKSPVYRATSTARGVKNPDLLLGNDLWEMKSPLGGGKSTISHQFERARKQTNRLVLDLDRTPLLDEDVLNEVRRRVAWTDAKINEVLIIFKDGTGLLLVRRP